MTDGITPRQFYEAEGVADWLVLAEGAEAFFRTGSFAASVRLVAAIGQLGEVDLVRDEFAPSWWALADAAGNEADIATTIGRD